MALDPADQATTPEDPCPALFGQAVGYLRSYRVTVFFNKGCETGPMVLSPYPRRLESLTICGCNYKGSTFSSVI